MLPAPFSSAPRLADVLTSSLASVRSVVNPLALAPTASAVVIVVDGLGAQALKTRAGHARTLASRGKSAVAETVFPSTTAAALTSLTTGTMPGEHGMVGYRSFDAEHDRVVNQLNGWDEHMEPASWQRRRTVFERAAEHGVVASAIGSARYADSGFTGAVLRGARYVSGDTIESRFSAALALVDAPGRNLVYLYIAELDMVGHAHGQESAKWLSTLERIDAAVATFIAEVGKRAGIIVTADHGMVDVSRDRHVLFNEVPDLIAGVRHVGGEPRCLQLYVEPGSSASEISALADTWRDVEGDRAWIATREEALGAGWFGDTDAVVASRIGDIIVAPRKVIAYYDSRESPASRAMVGQHGSMTSEEMRVPLLKFGRFES